MEECVQFSAWNVYTGGDVLDPRDVWIFEDPSYKSVPVPNSEAAEAKADIQEYIEQSNRMSARYPLGNYGRYQSKTIMKVRTVTYGEWTEPE